MKKYLVFFAVFVAIVCLIVLPCAAAETTAAPSEPVDWFGGGVSGYSVTVSSTISDTSTLADWLRSIGATSESNAVGSFSGRVGSDSFVNRPIWSYSSGGSVMVISPNNNGSFTGSSFTSGSYTSSSLDGLDEAELVSGFTVSTIGSDGFVDSGVSDALSELGIIVQAILTNQYILIAIGLAVAVPLVGWGISKIKSLVKGY